MRILVQGKRQMVSFKSKKRREIDPADWIMVENTHEPIVDHDLWDGVRAKLSRKEKVRRTAKNTVGLFAGRIYCTDCKSPLAHMRKSLKSGEKGVYRCSRYDNNGGKARTPHYIVEGFVSAFVPNDIRLYAKLAIAEGIAAARQRGVHLGRPPKATPENFGELVSQWEKKRIPLEDVLSQCAVSTSTFYRKLWEHRLSQGKL